jgi:hypothetical protein
VEIPNDEFFSSAQRREIVWVKFIILVDDPGQVYFHDAVSDPFHYEFARDHIPAFQGMTRDQFEAVTLENEGRQAILGAVVVPLDLTRSLEYGVQLVSNDDLHPALVKRMMQTVAEHVTAPTGTQAFYFPLGASATCIDGKRDYLSSEGIAFGGLERWLTGDACYASGWALGKLVALPAAEVDAAYLDGRLTPDDILLLTDTAPAELPYLAGIITLTPSTPNAHTAILARSYGTPFAYVHNARARAAAQALEGQNVVVATTPAQGLDPFDSNDDRCDVRFIDVEGLPDEQLAEIRALRTPPVLEVTPKRPSGALTLPVDGLVLADIDRVGGKAANFGVLRFAAPEVTPTPAIALTFDLWDAFMEAPVPGGTTSLREEIAMRLAPHTWPADSRALDTALTGIRGLIKDATFPAAIHTSLLDALSGFDPERRIRFRSSTNVEDSDTFTGAGLYDSATGCLADDLDGDEIGPSRCNVAEIEEHGVLRAVQRVYSSFYFSNAYFERLRRGVREQEAGMGVLVHYSVPDSEELANGVGTLSIIGGSVSTAALVSQTGATSVTNPAGGSLPEEVQVVRYFTNEAVPDLVWTGKTSSLLPLGAHVLEHEGEYRDLMTLFSQVAREYGRLTDKAPPFALDFEYKKIAPGQLSIRQVRPLPVPSSVRDVTPFFVGVPETLCLYGGENADVFSMHRLKARLTLTGGGLSLTADNLGSRSLFTNVGIDYLDGASVQSLQGDPATFAGATHDVQTEGDYVYVLDAWTASGVTWTLRSRFTAKSARNENPVLTPDDFSFGLTATRETPVPVLEPVPGGELMPATRTEDAVELWGYCPESVEISPEFPSVIEQSFSSGGVEVVTSYWYPPPPGGAIAGYTAPAIKWQQTTISRLTTNPIVLTGYYSQTYAPNHHNTGGEYIFEPRLEPGLSASILAELEEANIAYLVIIDSDRQGVADAIWVQGLDGTFTPR